MVWINVGAQSTVSGPYILVTQLFSVRPQPVFQSPEASPSLVLLPWGMKKISSWLSSQVIVANEKACAFSLSHLGTLRSSEETQALISCLIIFCCHFQACSTHSINQQSSPKKFSQKSTTQARDS